MLGIVLLSYQRCINVERKAVFAHIRQCLLYQVPVLLVFLWRNVWYDILSLVFIEIIICHISFLVRKTVKFCCRTNNVVAIECPFGVRRSLTDSGRSLAVLLRQEGLHNILHEGFVYESGRLFSKTVQVIDRFRGIWEAAWFVRHHPDVEYLRLVTGRTKLCGVVDGVPWLRGFGRLVSQQQSV